MSSVLVIDKNKKPCNPIHSSSARRLLKANKAAIYLRYPFTIILKTENHNSTLNYDFKIDPGSKETGIAIVGTNGIVPFAGIIKHRSKEIVDDLKKRAALRRGRRNRKTRYRPTRFNNRGGNKENWLPPSIHSRMDHILTWCKRFSKLVPIKNFWMEMNKFDLAKMQNPGINGVQYQRGTLLGWEVREYLLEKYNHVCVYCGKTNVPFEIDHVFPKSKGGSNRISNLVLSCHSCNQKKGNKPISVYLKNKPKILKTILKELKTPLKDASAINIMRKFLLKKIQNEFDFNKVKTGTGAQTKFNRSQRKLNKEHYIDAACVGDCVPKRLRFKNSNLLYIKAVGYGNRQMTKTDAFGFRRKKKNGEFEAARERKKYYFGFKTHDVVSYNHKIYDISSCRKKGAFTLSLIKKINEKNISINAVPKKLKRVQKSNGYFYSII